MTYPYQGSVLRARYAITPYEGRHPLKLNQHVPHPMHNYNFEGVLMQGTKTALLIVVVALFLAGCVQQMESRDVASVKAQCKALMKDPRLDPLHGKLALNLSKPVPIQMLTIETVPSPKEKKALQVLFKIKAKCDNLKTTVFKKYEPQNTYLVQTLDAKYDIVLAHLYEGKISYGNANQLLQHARLEALGKYNKAVQKEAARAEQRRTQALEALQRQEELNQQKQQIQQERSGTMATTNCHWLGNNLSCTTY